MSRCTIAFHIHYHIRYYEYTLLSQQGLRHDGGSWFMTCWISSDKCENSVVKLNEIYL